jgi:hypothetical protein
MRLFMLIQHMLQENAITKIITLIIVWFIIGMNNSVFAKSSAAVLQSIPILMKGAEGGTGFDDLAFSTTLNKVIVPGGHTGRIFLVDPDTRKISIIEGLKVESGYKGGHGQGTTSADEGDGLLLAIDRSAMLVDVIDPIKKQIILSVALTSGPDYVRYVKETNEVWVTQPSSERIEIFTFSTKPKLTLIYSGFIDVPGGPESLIVDHTRQYVYTHLWEGKTVAIDLHTHVIVKQWSNGCNSSRGIALDEKHGFLFAGCAEGKAVVMDINKDGMQISSLMTPSGVDVIGYNPKLAHLYLSSSTLSVIAVSDQGKLSLLGTGKAAQDTHCVTGDDQGNIWVCDPDHGQLLLYKDSF